MARATPQTIVIQAASPDGTVVRQEALAGAANITPGELLVISAADTVVQHAAASGVLTGKLVALETQTPDDETALTIDVDYANGDTVYFAEGRPGDEYYMWLADTENAALSDQLQSDGNGHLLVSAGGAGILANSIVGYAQEAVNNAAGGAPARIRVRII